MTLYDVTLRFQYPAWDEQDGILYIVDALSRAAAIRIARRQAERDGHTGGGRGRYWFSALEMLR